MKSILSISYFFLSSLLGINIYSQSIQPKEIKYQVNINSFSSDTTYKSDSFGSTVSLEYNIITNGKYYLLHIKIRNIYISFNKLEDFENEEDSFLIRNDSLTIYNLKEKRCYKLLTENLGKSIKYFDALDKKFKVQQNSSSTIFYQDSSLNKIITPFPQYVGNLFGITSVKNKKVDCKLRLVRDITYNFNSIVDRVKKFEKTNDTYPLPL